MTNLVLWQPIINAQVVEAVNVGSQIDLALAADMAGISLTELYRLKPWLQSLGDGSKRPTLFIITV